MQVRLAKANADLFDQFTDLTSLILVESPQLLEQRRINLKL